jgi:putative ABC transport system permease protein
MASLAVRMMFHDKLKMAGTLVGVVFAVVLSNQQAGTFLGLMKKNTMFIDNAGADLWIVPASTPALQPGKPIGEDALHSALVTPGVAWAEPMLYGGATVSLPGGGSEQVTLVGTRLPMKKGGPWNLVAGSADALAHPDTMLFEDSERDKLGGLNLGSIREVNGHKIRVGGFTWGLVPFGASYAFAEYDLARRMLRGDVDQTSFVLVGLASGANPGEVRDALQARMPKVEVLTTAQFSRATIRHLLTRTPIGVTFGTSTLFALIVGFVIVALSMFSAVVDNVREFGTLKAIGATTWDLAKLLFLQSIVFALMGSTVGLAAVTQIAGAIRSPKLGVQLPPAMLLGTTLMMIFICIAASSLALLRLRKVEPAMVFR